MDELHAALNRLETEIEVLKLLLDEVSLSDAEISHLVQIVECSGDEIAAVKYRIKPELLDADESE